MTNYENSVSKFDSFQYSTLDFADYGAEISCPKRPYKFAKISKKSIFRSANKLFYQKIYTII